MKTLVIIPARGGSKGIPKKNIKELGDKPLICHTIEQARNVYEDADICVTTDSEEIKKVVEKTGLQVPFLRPPELATDTAGSYEVLLHALNYYEQNGKQYEVIALLQPTSPLRNEEDIQNAAKLFDDQLDMVVSVKETASNPYYALFEENENGVLEKSKQGNFIRRQDCPKVWEYNGAVYIMNVKSLKAKPINSFSKIKKYVMPETRSVDIDSPLDWIIAEEILKRNGTI